MELSISPILYVNFFIDVIKTPLKERNILFYMPFTLEKFKDNIIRAGQEAMRYAPNGNF